MAFDLSASLRKLKPQRRTESLLRRSDDELMFVDAESSGGPPLLLDTTVYIDVLQARAPEAVRNLLRVRQLNHSSVAIGELTHVFGRLDPSRRESKEVLAQVRGVLEEIPTHRLSTPSVQSVAEAGIITGIIARLRGVSKLDRQPLLNDATLFLHALESGSTLLSRNISDMDVIEQIVPSGRVLLYRQA